MEVKNLNYLLSEPTSFYALYCRDSDELYVEWARVALSQLRERKPFRNVRPPTSVGALPELVGRVKKDPKKKVHS